MTHLHQNDCVARLGSHRGAAPRLIGTEEAAKLLGLSKDRVRDLADAGELRGTLVELPRETRAKATGGVHPWQKQDVREFAQLAARRGQDASYELPAPRSTPRRAKAEPESMPHRLVWRFRREDVLRFKAKRDRAARAKAARRRRSKIFGGDVNPTLPRSTLSRSILPRVARLRASGQESAVSVSDAAVASTSALLAWSAPPHL